MKSAWKTWTGKEELEEEDWVGLGLAPPQLQQLHRPLSVEVGQSHVHLYRLGAAAATGAVARREILWDKGGTAK